MKYAAAKYKETLNGNIVWIHGETSNDFDKLLKNTAVWMSSENFYESDEYNIPLSRKYYNHSITSHVDEIPYQIEIYIWNIF